jgi:hypothetical protein
MKHKLAGIVTWGVAAGLLASCSTSNGTGPGGNSFVAGTCSATVNGAAFSAPSGVGWNAAATNPKNLIITCDDTTHHQMQLAIPYPPQMGLTNFAAATVSNYYGQYTTYDYGNQSTTYATIGSTGNGAGGSVTITTYDPNASSSYGSGSL